MGARVLRDSSVAASTEDGRFSRAAPAIATQVIETGQTRRAHGGAGNGPVLVEPVQRGRRTVAALLVRWRRAVGDVDETSLASLSLLAAQAALAIERADLAEELARQAETDPLTGVANRRGLARALERDLAAARRSDRRLAVAVLDLDHFKAYNDARGHQAGDLLLRAAARAWREHLRAGDLLARYGGEEFVVVLPEAGDAAAAMRAVERVRDSTPGVTASAGVAVWDGAEPAAQLHPPRRRRALRGQAQRARSHGARGAGHASRFSPQKLANGFALKFSIGS